MDPADPPALKPLVVPAAAGAVVLVLAFWPGAFEALAWERDALGRGEFWRSLTGQFVHLGPGHVVLNLAGLAACAALFRAEFRLAGWLGAFAASLAGVAVGLQWFSPAVDWYVGLSGALHGLFAAGAWAWVARGRGAGWALLGFLAAKLAVEARLGPSGASEWLTGGPVLAIAHVWGALGGTAWGLAGLAAGRVYNAGSGGRQSWRSRPWRSKR